MDFSIDEITAIERSLPGLGKHVVDKGIGDKAFNDLTRDEALGFVVAAIRNYRAAFDETMKGVGW